MPDYPAQLQRRFGTALREQRTSRNLTQQDLALAADLSLTFVGEIERGERMASLHTIERVAHALGMTGAQLLAAAGI